MSKKVIVVTSPDDVTDDAYRILLVDLSPAQGKMFSDTLLEINCKDLVVVYLWENTNDINWLLDKKSKSELIIFNADSQNEIIVGYMTAQRNSHYLGILKSLGSANSRAIYASEDLKHLLMLTFGKS